MSDRRTLALGAACAVLATVIVALAWPNAGVGDLFQFWYAGHLVLAGLSPYDPQAWGAASQFGDLARNVVSNCSPTPLEPTCVWIYPPATAVIFVPFALLAPQAGTFALELVLVTVGLLSLGVLARWMSARSAVLPYLAFAALVVSHPFVFDLRAGHFEGLGVIGLVAIAVGFTRRSALLIATGALLLSLKPHLYLIVGCLTLVWLIRRRHWSGLVLTAGVLALVQGGALLRYPESLAAILSRSAGKADLGWASTAVFAASLIPPAPLIGVVIVYGLTFAALIVAALHAPSERRAAVLVSGAAAVSIAVSPYTHPYDLMALFPAIVMTLVLVEETRARERVLVRAIVLSVVAVGTWAAIAINQADSALALPGALAAMVTLLLAFASWLARRRAPSSVQALVTVARSRPANAM